MSKLFLLCIVVAALAAEYIPIDPPSEVKYVKKEWPDRPQSSAATFNTALYPLYFPFVQERGAAIVGSLMASDLDALCVQEVWLNSSLFQMQGALAHAGNLPHMVPSPNVPGMCWCTQETITPLIMCSMQCANETSPMECLAERCTAEALSLDRSCQSCLSTDLPGLLDGSISFEDTVNRCIMNSYNPAKDSNTCRSFGGNSGIALFTKNEPIETDFHVFNAVNFARAVVYAKVRLATGVTHVFCSHTTPADWDNYPADGDAGSAAAENKEHIEEILKFADSKVGFGGRVIIMGDHNTGPGIESAGIQPNEAANYALFTKAGLDNAQTEGSDPKCTFCAENPLQQVVPRRSYAIDHVLTSRGICDAGNQTNPMKGSKVSAELFLDEYDVPPYNIPRSDHYGVKAELQGPPCLFPCVEGYSCIITGWGVPKCCKNAKSGSDTFYCY